ncbi:carbohydrate ABC transporter permease [Haliovirga abyssi]|uniref:ABC transmembrane type-1 domain-containing protein n=1 Tax=Haliovirga abyssi TaxID=2996794 RepID=A0AAU9DFS7_9FUSO|nr:sugar ABC transporter permease [Haliovirga abyssi]BDU51068.1 hypothetical protein HLVA_16370 [Haliovirga abyssi]
MKQNKTTLYTASFLLFLLFAITLFFSRNTYLGGVLDNKKVKRKVMRTTEYRKSDLKKDSIFRRFPLSTTISMKKYRGKILQFKEVKKYQKLTDNELSKSNFVFYSLIIISLIFAFAVLAYKRLYFLLTLNTILTAGVLLYDKLLGIGLHNLGLKVSVINKLGVAEVTQHVVVITVYIISLIYIIRGGLKKEEKKSVKENIEETKKEITKTYNWVKKERFAYYMLFPAVLIVLVIIIYPFLYNFRISFSNLNLKRFIVFIKADKLYYNGFENYLSIFGDVLFWKVFMRTIIWTFANIFFHVTGGIFLAILLNREMKMRPVYQTLIIMPWAIPQFIAVLVWKGMFNGQYGAINLMMNDVLRFFHINATVTIPWLTNANWMLTGAIITNVWLGIPFMMMIALGGLQSIPETYYEAAEIDGATSWEQIKNITLPLLKPVMTPAVIMGVVWTFNNVNVIYLMSQDKLTGKVDILVTYVYKAAFNLYRYGYAAAFSVAIFLILMVFSVLLIKVTKAEEGVR